MSFEYSSIRYMCGMTRSLMMAALVNELLELRQRIEQSGDEEFELRLVPEAEGIEDEVQTATQDHALMVNNWTTAGEQPEVEVLLPGFCQSVLEHADETPSIMEHRVCASLLEHYRAEISVPPCPYPLCELAISLSEEIRSRVDQRQQMLQSARALARQRVMAETHDDAFQRVIQRTIEVGMMTADEKWEADVTRAQKAYWVDRAARRFHIARQWKWAKERWGLVNLAQEQTRNLAGRHVPRRQLIDLIFESTV